jgi:hypothetical protein
VARAAVELQARYQTANRFTIAAALVCLVLSVVTTKGDASLPMRSPPDCSHEHDDHQREEKLVAAVNG